jgi:hypothetical protein
VRPSPSSTRRALLGLFFLTASGAHAQAEVSGSAQPTASAPAREVGEAWQARVRYGLAYRSGAQSDSGPGLTYSGLTENDIAAQAWAWLGYAGLHLSFQREGFSLNDTTTSTLVTQGSVMRFAGQIAGRFPLGPLRLEPYAGYQFAQIPVFSSTLSPAFGTATRHAVLLAARVLVDVGPVEIEGRGEIPISIATSVPGATAAVSHGFAAGGGVRVQIFNVDKLHFGALLDAQYISDQIAAGDANVHPLGPIAANQGVIRAGLSIDVQWKEPPRVITTGGVLVSVLDVDTGAPVPGANVVVSAGGQDRTLSPDANGALAARELPQGQFTLKASAGGYLPFESAGSVAAGVDTPLELKLKKEPPKVGALTITVKELDTNKPLVGVALTLGDLTATTDANGVAKVQNLKPGPVAITMTLEGYQKGEEAGSVVAGKTSEMNVTLVPEKKRVPATIKGLVRSLRGGAPVAADLELPQAKLKTKANEKGEFTFRVEGGTYTVKISAPGYVSQTKEVTVKDGDQAIFNVDLYSR